MSLSLSPRGRMIIIGFISTYPEDSTVPLSQLTSSQLSRFLRFSLNVSGFLIYDYPDKWGESFARQAEHLAKGSVKVTLDYGKNSEKGPFKGLEGIADAVEFLYSRKSQGKLVVEINEALPTAGL